MTARRPYTLPDLEPCREPEQDNAMPPRSEEFGLWCTITDRPFRLIKLALDYSGQPEWAIEAHPGTEQAAVIYATGTIDEALALSVAYSFLAGVEWSEAALAPALEPEDAEDSSDEAEVFALALSVPLVLPPPLMGGELLTAEVIPGEEPVFDFRALAAANSAEAEAEAVDMVGPVAAEPEAAPVADDEMSDGDDADAAAAETSDDTAEDAFEAPVYADLEVDDAPTDEDPLDDILDEDLDDTDPEDKADAVEAGDDGTGDDGAETWDDAEQGTGYVLPALALLATPEAEDDPALDEGVMAYKTRKLETMLRNFRVRGEIMEVKRGPLVTLFELEPVPGTKSSTVINLADDIARSMSAITARIAVVPGRSVIGVELPNE